MQFCKTYPPIHSQVDNITYRGSMSKLTLILVLSAILSGCTLLGREVACHEPEKCQPLRKYKIITNYNIGEKITSNIGSAMISAEDIIVNDYTNWECAPAFKALSDFELSGNFQSRRFLPENTITNKYNADTIFNVICRMTVDGNKYHVIRMRGTDSRFLVDEGGTLITNEFLVEGKDHYHLIGIGMKTNPNAIKLDYSPPLNESFQTFTKFGSSGSYRSDSKYVPDFYDNRPKNVPEVNYELIYDGKSSNTIHIVYREYTSEGFARQAFYQNLKYESTAKTIRFKNINIEILSADNERIVFKVLDDDIINLERIGNSALPF